MKTLEQVFEIELLNQINEDDFSNTTNSEKENLLASLRVYERGSYYPVYDYDKWETNRDKVLIGLLNCEVSYSQYDSEYEEDLYILLDDGTAIREKEYNETPVGNPEAYLY